MSFGRFSLVSSISTIENSKLNIIIKASILPRVIKVDFIDVSIISKPLLCNFLSSFSLKLFDFCKFSCIIEYTYNNCSNVMTY